MSDSQVEMFPLPHPGPPRRLNWLTLTLLLLVTGLLWRIWREGQQRSLLDPRAESRPVEARGDLAQDEKTTIQIFKQTSPAVVHVTTQRYQRGFRRTDEVPSGSGTGFLWDGKGHVVTNAHVLQNADRAQVAIGSRAFAARLVGFDPDKDLAVLKIDAPAELLQPITLGTSADLQVGQKVFAIGSPFGLDHTLTTGVISGLKREFTSLTNRPIGGAIQTDAAINPGNSGGPLLDSAGRLIGINTAIYSKSGQSAGVGFAIPVDTVNRIVPQILKYGHPQKIGIGIEQAPDTWLEILIRNGIYDRLGILVSTVKAGSSAERAGIKGFEFNEEGEPTGVGDLLTAVNEQPVRSENDLYRILDPLNPGDIVQVTVRRGNRDIVIPVPVEVTSTSN